MAFDNAKKLIEAICQYDTIDLSVVVADRNDNYNAIIRSIREVEGEIEIEIFSEEIDEALNKPFYTIMVSKYDMDLEAYGELKKSPNAIVQREGTADEYLSFKTI